MTTALFIHGFPFDRLLWRHQLPVLSRQWRCLAPDLRGAGAGPVPTDPASYSVASYADDLVALLDREEVDQAVVCGLSLGGYIVFELLRRFPSRVRAAVLCNTKAAADTPEAKRGRDELAARARNGGATVVADELVPKLLSRVTRAQRPEVVREVREMISRQSVDGIVGALHALRERPDSTALLEHIGVPVLVMAGDDDQIAPAEGMLGMSQAIPDAQFALISETGHISPLENPLAVNHHLERFLARV
jgi:pimeloyl-ACP methyl ester carboxylesterase